MENEMIRIEREIAEIKAKQAAADEQHKTIFHRLDKQDEMIESVRKLATSVERLTLKQDNIQNKVNDLCADVDEIKARPGKRWDSIIEKVVLTIVGALVGAALVKLGLK